MIEDIIHNSYQVILLFGKMLSCEKFLDLLCPFVDDHVDIKNLLNTSG